MPDFTASDGTRLHFTDQGEGETLLLLHGLGSSGLDWEHQIAHFASRYRVIATDIRGHGQSAVPDEGFSIERFGRDQVELIEQLGLAQVHVIGISMGGAVAFQVAADTPNRVASLCIVNSGPTAKTRDPRILFALWLRKLLARFGGPAKTAPMVAEKLFPGEEMAALRATFIERVSRTDPVAYRKSLNALLRFDLEHRLGELAMPTLFLCAEYDYMPPASKQVYVDAMPNARLEIVPGTRHGLPIEAPALFNAALDKFLEANRDG